MVQWWKRLKCRRYFVQFIVWEGIPSSLPFGTDVVPKSRERGASEGGMGITCVEEIGVTHANLSALDTDVTWYPTENYIVVVIN